MRALVLAILVCGACAKKPAPQAPAAAPAAPDSAAAPGGAPPAAEAPVERKAADNPCSGGEQKQK